MFFMWVSEKHFPVKVLMNSNKSRFRKVLIIFGNFYLFPVFKNLFKVISSGGEFRDFLFQLFLHFKGDLVRSL